MSEAIKIRILKTKSESPFQDVTVGQIYDATTIEAGDEIADPSPLGQMLGLVGEADEAGVSFTDDVGDVCHAKLANQEGVYFERVTE